jgi:D-alanyl-D-alanine carboxypeptidase (penicillin-binding protein 5/6)
MLHNDMTEAHARAPAAAAPAPTRWLAILLFLLLPPAGVAAQGAEPPAAAAATLPPPPAIDAAAHLLMDADSGRVLVEHESTAPRPPASLTKIMTGYVAAAELAAGRIHLDDQVPVSVRAWQTGGSRMFIREGTTVRLEDLLRGMVIQSGNDAAVAIAEYIAGSEDAFAQLMNATARRIGIGDLHFTNATGLPDPQETATALGLARLAERLIEDFPEHYRLHSERTFTWNGIVQHNRNELLGIDPSIDGVKTGFTEAAGYCLIASARRNGMRLIAVVLGAPSTDAREEAAQKLLSYGFRYFETRGLYAAGEPVRDTEVWGGASDTARLGVAGPVVFTLTRGRFGDVKAETEIPRIVHAPLAAGTELGEVRLTLDGQVLAKAPLRVLEEVPAGNVLKRVWHAIVLFFRELFA